MLGLVRFVMVFGEDIQTIRRSLPQVFVRSYIG
jgi:hypothetical protein